MTRRAVYGWLVVVVAFTFLTGRWLFGPGGIGTGLWSGSGTNLPNGASGVTSALGSTQVGGSTPAGVGAVDPAESPQRPMQIDIPSIGVASSLIYLGMNADRTVQVPSSFSEAGWYQGSAVPGNAGKPTVILGHVDSTSGPAVFYRLKLLQPGASVWILRADQSWVRYVIDRVREVPKTRFPTKLVYAPQRGTTIRLVTCGGAFDHSTGHYVDNIIAFGHLA